MGNERLGNLNLGLVVKLELETYGDFILEFSLSVIEVPGVYSVSKFDGESGHGLRPVPATVGTNHQVDIC